jgi:hypothetical protein
MFQNLLDCAVLLIEHQEAGASECSYTEGVPAVDSTNSVSCVMRTVILCVCSSSSFIRSLLNGGEGLCWVPGSNFRRCVSS